MESVDSDVHLSRSQDAETQNQQLTKESLLTLCQTIKRKNRDLYCPKMERLLFTQLRRETFRTGEPRIVPNDECVFIKSGRFQLQEFRLERNFLEADPQDEFIRLERDTHSRLFEQPQDTLIERTKVDLPCLMMRWSDVQKLIVPPAPDVGANNQGEASDHLLRYSSNEKKLPRQVGVLVAKEIVHQLSQSIETEGQNLESTSTKENQITMVLMLGDTVNGNDILNLNCVDPKTQLHDVASTKVTKLRQIYCTSEEAEIVVLKSHEFMTLRSK